MKIGQLIRRVWIFKHRGRKRKTREPVLCYREIIERSDKLLECKRLFLNESFCIDTLAREIGTNRTYLSRSIKHCRQENFSGYINRVKIEYAKRLISEKVGNSVTKSGKCFVDLEDIAIASGFGSRRSFVRCFRQLEGVTPSQYKNHRDITLHPPSPPQDGGWL